jgi:hypothetical protein
VKKNRLLSLILLGVAIAISITSQFLTRNLSATPVAASPPEANLQYKVYDLPKSTVHTLSIPAASRFKVAIALSPSVDRLETFARSYQAIAVLNGGFFDPKNAKTTSYVIREGQMVADPRQNERLMQNPDLSSYLDKILNRSEWRQYHCGETMQHAIAFHSDPIPDGCRAIDTLGGGPRLLPQMTAEAEGFIEFSNGKIIRDALGMEQANARSAVGITAERTLIWIMAAQKPDSPGNSGLSLAELADFLKTLGVKEAINLDGGSSSALYYQGETFYGKVDETGKLLKRPVKSVLLLQHLERR